MVQVEDASSHSGEYYVNKKRNLFVKASLRNRDGTAEMPLDGESEGLNIKWAKKGFIKVNVNPTHVVLKDGVVAYDDNTILVGDGMFKDYTKKSNLLSRIAAVLRGRSPRVQ